MSYVYIRPRGENLYTVGFFEPDGTWHSESDHSTRDEAAARVNYLNGGPSRDVVQALDAISAVIEGR